MNGRIVILVALVAFGSNGCATSNSTRTVSTSVSLDSSGNMVVACTITAAAQPAPPPSLPQPPKPAEEKKATVVSQAGGGTPGAAPAKTGPAFTLLSTAVNVTVASDNNSASKPPHQTPSAQEPNHPRPAGHGKKRPEG